MRALRAAAACGLAILVSACTPKVDAPADVQAIKEATTAWDKAWIAGDADALASLYADNAIAMPPNLPARAGKDVLRASSKKYFALFKDENRSLVEDVRVSGNLAVAWGTQETQTTPRAGGSPVQDKSKWITVYQRQPDKSWRILWEMYNSDLPVPDSRPMATEKMRE
jgi:uncharacterized protein (TIGR02246 family)